jgi:hypothetical protein
MTEEVTYTKPIQGVLFSKGYGHGKTVALVSFRRPKETPKRLLIDNERRARTYKASNGRDKPKQLLFSFDYFHERYAEQMPDGEWTPEALITLYEDVRGGKFPYTVLLIDNAAMLQEELVSMLLDGGKPVCTKLAKAFRGVYNKHARFIEYNFKTSSTVDIYGIVKDVLEELLRVCQRKDIDVLVATESKNVWYKYGTRDMKILGQSAKVLSPFMKYADFSYRLSRETGNRDIGTAKLVDVPWAIMDTFNPKNSLPGLKPKFEFTWDEFWKLVTSRGITTQKELDEIKVEESEIPEETGDPERNREIAKKKWLSVAQDAGISKRRLVELLEKHELIPDDAADPKKFKKGLEIIESYSKEKPTDPE